MLLRLLAALSPLPTVVSSLPAPKFSTLFVLKICSSAFSVLSPLSLATSVSLRRSPRLDIMIDPLPGSVEAGTLECLRDDLTVLASVS